MSAESVFSSADLLAKYCRWLQRKSEDSLLFLIGSHEVKYIFNIVSVERAAFHRQATGACQLYYQLSARISCPIHQQFSKSRFQKNHIMYSDALRLTSAYNSLLGAGRFAEY